MNLNTLIKPIEPEFESFKSYFMDFLSESDDPQLSNILQYAIRRQGKMLRPALVLMTAKALGNINERTFLSAAAIELLHCVSLIHDDVVDGADLRRGLKTINASLSDNVAVLFGDYLLSHCFNKLIAEKEYEVLGLLMSTFKKMSIGEIIQQTQIKNMDISEDKYYGIISAKTGYLFSASCKAGAMSVNSDLNTQNAMEDYGLNLGLAFQIKDDIFDYEAKTEVIGKPAGLDIKERKITLPLIYALSNGDISRKKTKVKQLLLREIIEDDDLIEISNFVKAEGGLDYASSKSLEFVNRAFYSLKVIPDSDEKRALIGLADFVVSRNV